MQIAYSHFVDQILMDCLRFLTIHVAVAKVTMHPSVEVELKMAC